MLLAWTPQGNRDQHCSCVFNCSSKDVLFVHACSSSLSLMHTTHKQEHAFEASQKYKEGKFIIELAHMVKENRWE